MDFERYPNQTAEDAEATALVGELYRDETFNRDYYQYLQQKFAEQWQGDGFSDPLLFIDRDGSSVAISRYEGLERPYDNEHELIRVHIQWLEDGETRDDERTVILPPSILVGKMPDDIRSNSVVFYEFPEDAEEDMFLFELAATDPDPENSLIKGVSWLHEVFGKSLSAQRAGMTPARLRDGDGLRGVRLDAINPFYERDF